MLDRLDPKKKTFKVDSGCSLFLTSTIRMHFFGGPFSNRNPKQTALSKAGPFETMALRWVHHQPHRADFEQIFSKSMGKYACTPWYLVLAFSPKKICTFSVFTEVSFLKKCMGHHQHHEKMVRKMVVVEDECF